VVQLTATSLDSVMRVDTLLSNVQRILTLLTQTTAVSKYKNLSDLFVDRHLLKEDIEDK